jgi:hypothetical protein
MRVIKRRALWETEKQFDCRKCKSTLSATRGEGQVIHDLRPGESCIKFKCPVCGGYTYVSDWWPH